MLMHIDGSGNGYGDVDEYGSESNKMMIMMMIIMVVMFMTVLRQ